MSVSSRRSQWKASAKIYYSFIKLSRYLPKILVDAGAAPKGEAAGAPKGLGAGAGVPKPVAGAGAPKAGLVAPKGDAWARSYEPG